MAAELRCARFAAASGPRGLSSVRFGVTLPNLGVGEDLHLIIDLAREAEDAGWEGVFVWDAPYMPVDSSRELRNVHEAWIALALIAESTERLALGTLITPLAWRIPWLVARQALTLDRLSGGRFVLSVGLGHVEGDRTPFGDVTDRRTRARMLDEALEVLAGLWGDEPFAFDGEHYRVDNMTFLPSPVRGPRIPVWVVGAWHRDPSVWPKKRSLRRALRWDGVLPFIFGTQPNSQATPNDLRAMTEWIREERREPIDIIWEAVSLKGDGAGAAEAVRPWAEAGATWWLEAVWWEMYRKPGDVTEMRRLIRLGPPKID